MRFAYSFIRTLPAGVHPALGSDIAPVDAAYVPNDNVYNFERQMTLPGDIVIGYTYAGAGPVPVLTATLYIYDGSGDNWYLIGTGQVQLTAGHVSMTPVLRLMDNSQLPKGNTPTSRSSLQVALVVAAPVGAPVGTYTFYLDSNLGDNFQALQQIIADLQALIDIFNPINGTGGRVQGTVADGGAAAGERPVGIGAEVLDADPAPDVDGIIRWLRLDSLRRLIVRSAAFDTGLQSDRAASVNPSWSQAQHVPQPLIAAAQNFTGAWVDLGPELDMRYYNRLAVFGSYTQHDSTGLQIRALAKHTSGGAGEYPLEILSPSTGATPYKILIDDEVLEFAENTSRSFCLIWKVENVLPFVQLQIQALAVGAVATVLSEAFVTKAWSGG